nr:uncharacterized protein CI109_007487 [Kwoniella shandongensis]KAA5524205.1 hypothetical protein CI109_007487 [Kwoniella shandongensis]
MKLELVTACALALQAAPASAYAIDRRAATPVKNNGKRGLSFNQANLTSPFSLSGQNSKVSWAYNWAQTQTGSGFNPVLEFVPMLWSNAAELLSSWKTNAQKGIDNGATALLSFNEPDFCISGSACMSVSASVDAYKKYMQPFAGKALLGSPAVTNQGSPGGLTYLQDFIGNCTGCTIDFITLHWYSNHWAGANYLKSHVEAARKIAGGRPIWITEFALDNSDGVYTQDDLRVFLQTALPWLDAQPDVHRYAYFMDAPGMLINSAGTALSDSGVLYNNYTGATATAAKVAATSSISSSSTSKSTVTSSSLKTSSASTAKASSSSAPLAKSSSTSLSKTSSTIPKPASSTISTTALSSSFNPASIASSSKATAVVSTAKSSATASTSKAISVTASSANGSTTAQKSSTSVAPKSSSTSTSKTSTTTVRPSSSTASASKAASTTSKAKA